MKYLSSMLISNKDIVAQRTQLAFFINLLRAVIGPSANWVYMSCTVLSPLHMFFTSASIGKKCSLIALCVFSIENNNNLVVRYTETDLRNANS